MSTALSKLNLYRDILLNHGKRIYIRTYCPQDYKVDIDFYDKASNQLTGSIGKHRNGCGFTVNIPEGTHHLTAWVYPPDHDFHDDMVSCYDLTPGKRTIKTEHDGHIIELRLEID